jgi:hypothetical protein
MAGSPRRRRKMTVKEIIQAYLKANGYDGLCNPIDPCGCSAEDLCACIECMDNCVPANKHIVEADDENDFNQDYDVGEEIFVEVENPVSPLFAAPPNRDDDAMREGVKDEKVKRLIEAANAGLKTLLDYADADEAAGLNGQGCYSEPLLAIGPTVDILRAALAEVDAEGEK